MPSQIIEFIKIYRSYTTFEFHAKVWAMDKMAKVLLLACFILVGALGFTIGMLINIWEENLPTPYTLNKTINHTSSDNTTDNSKSSGLKYDEYGRPICPYCGISCSVPIKIPYLLDENGILHKACYASCPNCGYKVYVGEETAGPVDDEHVAEDWRQWVREHGGEVYY